MNTKSSELERKVASWNDHCSPYCKNSDNVFKFIRHSKLNGERNNFANKCGTKLNKSKTKCFDGKHNGIKTHHKLIKLHKNEKTEKTIQYKSNPDKRATIIKYTTVNQNSEINKRDFSIQLCDFNKTPYPKLQKFTSPPPIYLLKVDANVSPWLLFKEKRSKKLKHKKNKNMLHEKLDVHSETSLFIHVDSELEVTVQRGNPNISVLLEQRHEKDDYKKNKTKKKSLEYAKTNSFDWNDVIAMRSHNKRNSKKISQQTCFDVLSKTIKNEIYAMNPCSKMKLKERMPSVELSQSKDIKKNSQDIEDIYIRNLSNESIVSESYSNFISSAGVSQKNEGSYYSITVNESKLKTSKISANYKKMSVLNTAMNNNERSTKLSRCLTLILRTLYTKTSGLYKRWRDKRNGTINLASSNKSCKFKEDKFRIILMAIKSIFSQDFDNELNNEYEEIIGKDEIASKKYVFATEKRFRE